MNKTNCITLLNNTERIASHHENKNHSDGKNQRVSCIRSARVVDYPCVIVFDHASAESRFHLVYFGNVPDDIRYGTFHAWCRQIHDPDG